MPTPKDASPRQEGTIRAAMPTGSRPTTTDARADGAKGSVDMGQPGRPRTPANSHRSTLEGKANPKMPTPTRPGPHRPVSASSIQVVDDKMQSRDCGVPAPPPSLTESRPAEEIAPGDMNTLPSTHSPKQASLDAKKRKNHSRALRERPEGQLKIFEAVAIVNRRCALAVVTNPHPPVPPGAPLLRNLPTPELSPLGYTFLDSHACHGIIVRDRAERFGAGDDHESEAGSSSGGFSGGDGGESAARGSSGGGYADEDGGDVFKSKSPMHGNKMEQQHAHKAGVDAHEISFNAHKTGGNARKAGIDAHKSEGPTHSDKMELQLAAAKAYIQATKAGKPYK